MELNDREIAIHFTLALMYVSIPTMHLPFDRVHKSRTIIVNSHLGSLIVFMNSMQPTLFRSPSRTRYNHIVTYTAFHLCASAIMESGIIHSRQDSG